MSHPKDAPPIPTFRPGQIVFANSEGNKLTARDQLIVREDLGNGMYRLDRVKASGKITRAFLPARDLYSVKAATQDEPKGKLQPAPVEDIVPEEGLEIHGTPEQRNDSDLFPDTPEIEDSSKSNDRDDKGKLSLATDVQALTMPTTLPMPSSEW